MKYVSKILKYILKIPVYIYLALSALCTLFTFYELYNHNSYYSINIKTVKVQPVIVSGHTDSFFIFVGIHNMLKIASDKFEKETGIKIIWLKTKYIENKEWNTVHTTDSGKSETNIIIEKLYERNPVVVFTYDIIEDNNDHSTIGVASWSRNGAILRYNCNSSSITHELCHVFNLNHYYFEDNLMFKDGDLSTDDLTKPQIGKMKRKILRKGWE